MDSVCGGRTLRTDGDDFKTGRAAGAERTHFKTHGHSTPEDGRSGTRLSRLFFAPLRKDPAIGAGTNRWDELAAGSLTVFAKSHP